MKKIISILLAVMVLGVCACAATAEEIPQPEAGQKFEGSWAVPGGLAQIIYEEQGYKVSVEIIKPEAGGGTVWEYSCYCHEDTDSLVSVTSLRTDYTFNPDNGEKIYRENAYEGFDEEAQCTEFTIENGCLIWKDGRENAGAGLKFTDIGPFEGVWRNEAEETTADFLWNGLDDPERFEYTVYITCGKPGTEGYVSYVMTGTYDPAAGKLSASGTSSADDGENYEAVFSLTKDGKLLYEADKGIELTYDIMGRQ